VTRLPRGLSGKEVVKALGKVGFYFKRKKGSHIVLRRNSPFAQVVVPDHKSIDTGTLDSILDGANLSVDEFIRLLK
jgi:predicted RNA binding protein YcfA (HicA-like mRNA interferase family)